MQVLPPASRARAKEAKALPEDWSCRCRWHPTAQPDWHRGKARPPHKSGNRSAPRVSPRARSRPVPQRKRLRAQGRMWTSKRRIPIFLVSNPHRHQDVKRALVLGILDEGGRTGVGKQEAHILARDLA